MSLVVSARLTAIKSLATLEGRGHHCKLDNDAALREHVIEDTRKFVKNELISDNWIDSDDDDRLFTLKQEEAGAQILPSATGEDGNIYLIDFFKGLPHAQVHFC